MHLLGVKTRHIQKGKTGRVACNQPAGTSLLGRLGAGHRGLMPDVLMPDVRGAALRSTRVPLRRVAFSERALRCMCWHPVGHLYLFSLRVNTYHITHT